MKDGRFRASAMSDHKVILNEHDVLLRDLRTVSHWEADLLRERKVRLQLARDLHSLQVRLRRHFSTEESGAYLAEISSRKPSARATLQALHNEHGMLLDLLSNLENACLDQDYEAGAQLAERLGQWLDMLKLHERRETALIQDVFRS